MNLTVDSTNQEKPANYLPRAILVSIFCNFPTGIWAVIQCCKVKRDWSHGLKSSAIEAATNAKKYINISLVIFLVSIKALQRGWNEWLYVELLANAICVIIGVANIIYTKMLHEASKLVEITFTLILLAITIATAIGLDKLVFSNH